MSRGVSRTRGVGLFTFIRRVMSFGGVSKKPEKKGYPMSVTVRILGILRGHTWGRGPCWVDREQFQRGERRSKWS